MDGCDLSLALPSSLISIVVEYGDVSDQLRLECYVRGRTAGLWFERRHPLTKRVVRLLMTPDACGEVTIDSDFMAAIASSGGMITASAILHALYPERLGLRRAHAERYDAERRFQWPDLDVIVAMDSSPAGGVPLSSSQSRRRVRRLAHKARSGSAASRADHQRRLDAVRRRQRAKIASDLDRFLFARLQAQGLKAFSDEPITDRIPDGYDSYGNFGNNGPRGYLFASKRFAAWLDRDTRFPYQQPSNVKVESNLTSESKLNKQSESLQSAVVHVLALRPGVNPVRFVEEVFDFDCLKNAYDPVSGRLYVGYPLQLVDAVLSVHFDRYESVCQLVYRLAKYVPCGFRPVVTPLDYLRIIEAACPGGDSARERDSKSRCPAGLRAHVLLSRLDILRCWPDPVYELGRVGLFPP